MSTKVNKLSPWSSFFQMVCEISDYKLRKPPDQIRDVIKVSLDFPLSA